MSNRQINTFNNVGGMIQSCIYPGADQDRKYLVRSPVHGPAGFCAAVVPFDSVRKAVPLPVNTVPTIQRIQWLSTTAE